jgi:hypothetical protein
MNTYKIKIDDKIQSGGSHILNFDLKEILSSIENSSKTYNWLLSYYEFVAFRNPNTQANNLIIETKENTPLKILWEDLVLIAQAVLQTENMLLEGTDDKTFVKIEAIDTSFWEIETNNQLIIESINKDFKSVEQIS